MKHFIISGFLLTGILASCGGAEGTDEINNVEEAVDSVVYEPLQTDQIEKFADLQVLQYDIPGFYQLSLDQKKLVYYLYEAGLSGRDMLWDQNYIHNLEIRNALEQIVANYSGDKNDENWEKFMTYTNRVWFSNGIHHHYSMDKFVPDFSREYFDGIVKRIRRDFIF